MKSNFLLGFFLLLCAPGLAQSGTPSADIYLGLRKLGTLGSVLYMAAHPDDENTRLLTYLSKERLYRTGYLSLTRGDGGQNLIGDEQGVPLGLIRTQELLAARRIDGAEQFFTRAYDFGFSKTPEETFSKWDREKVLADAVWVIRNFRPDVIITRFPTTGEGGHGHHTASAILANEAFRAAGDPSRFPEQLRFVEPWAPKRVLWNVFNFGGDPAAAPGQFTMDVGGYNAVLGLSYGEIAAESRSQHKSQGFGVPRTRGEALETFRTTSGPAPSRDPMEDVATGWDRVPGGGAIASLVQEAVAGFDFVRPEATVPRLAAIHRAIGALPDSYWKRVKLGETVRLLQAASGLFAEAVTSTSTAVQGDSLQVQVILNNRLGVPVSMRSLSLAGWDTTLQATLPRNRNFSLTRRWLVSDTTPISQPYWLKESMEEAMFVVNDQHLIGRPEGPAAFSALLQLDIAGIPVAMALPVRYKYTDPVRGELYQPLAVMPPATVSVAPSVVVLPAGSKEAKSITVQLAPNRTLRADSLHVRLRSAGFNPEQKSGRTVLTRNLPQSYRFPVAPAAKRNASERLLPAAQFFAGPDTGAAYLSMAGIHYDHIPTIRYFYPDAARLLQIDLKTEGKRIGYITGAGDRVPEALEQMGYEVTLLDERAVASGNLQAFDAIMTGVRAYNTNEWLDRYYDRLMKYVEGGGNYIVQYVTASNAGPLKARIGPYPLTIGRARITDEKAAVRFLQPAHPLFTYPNTITSADFEGWVQERSIYHGSAPDARYQALIAMKDPGEGEEKGALLTVPYGKGVFTYTGLVFFRQLPAGVPGAYRLLANLIALNRKKPF